MPNRYRDVSLTMIYAADINSIQRAAERIAGYAHVTPVLTCTAIDRLAGRSLFFKCENFQKVGAFKFRGAMNATAKALENQQPSAFVTHSSGNHAQALALAAHCHGVPAHIVMPTNAPAVKKAAVLEYGATVHPCEPTLEARIRVATQVCDETSGILIPPYNHADVISGQGTVGLELNQQVPELDAVICPVGGGGLLSGVTLGYRELQPDCKMLAAEPSGADDAFRSKQSGQLLPQLSPQTIADGLRTSLGSLTWPVVRDLVDAIYVVTDQEIKVAMKLIWERMKIVIEPSSATVLAAVLSEGFDPEHTFRRIGLVISGGNLDLTALLD